MRLALPPTDGTLVESGTKAALPPHLPPPQAI